MSRKRDAIVQAADRLFYREGFAATGIDRVVEAADVALGTLYNHFQGRSALVVGALDHREAAYFAHLDRAAAGLKGPARVLGLFDGLLAWAKAEGGNGCLFLRAVAAHPLDAEIRSRVRRHKESYLALCRQRLREAGWEAGAARRLAPQIFLLLEGAVAAAAQLGDKTAVTQARRMAAELLQRDPAPRKLQQ
ncbi:MAG: TetR/AcrR family transcriptional regulator [Kiloniellaceae bacterium]